MKLTAMEQPWEYIKSLQSSFDYSKIKYTEDYYDMDMNPAMEPTVPEWKVYFEGSFWGHQGKDHAGKEIPIGKQFEWAGHHWLIPAAYSCSKGLVVDFCMRVEADEIRAFMKKWNLTQENDSWENYTREQQMELELDNPLCLHFNPRLELNGHNLRTSHGCAVTYNPCLPDGMGIELEAKWAAEHYGLDTSYGWVICRDAFPWMSKRRLEIKTLSLTMEQQPVSIPGHDSFAPSASSNAACIGIIGGADGPTTVVIGPQDKLCAACSALHFEPVQHDIEWRITFHEKRYFDFTLTLI